MTLGVIRNEAVRPTVELKMAVHLRISRRQTTFALLERLLPNPSQVTIKYYDDKWFILEHCHLYHGGYM